MTEISIRIPENLKTEMRKYNDVNWNEIILNAIETQIQNLKRKLKMIRADEELDKIRLRCKPVKKGEIDLWIREDRVQ
jgi:hypothetical protein